MIKENILGIKSIGTYIPEGIRDSHYIAEASGIPEIVIREKFGIKQVRRANESESVTSMAVEAAKDALGDLDPLSIDLVVYCGSEYKDYYLYNCASKIQYELGAQKAAAFEIHSLCSAGVYSLKIIKSMMLQDPEINRAIVVSSSKEGDLINYADNETRFMFNFGDGAAALLLEKGFSENVILDSFMISDGRFSEDVYVPAVGCKNFNEIEDLPKEDRFLKVIELSSMKERLDPITQNNFYKVIDEAIRKSGYEKKDLDFIAPIFMKRSMLVGMLEHYDLLEENSFLLEDYGHCQSADTFIALKEGERLGRLKSGDLAVMVSAGTGYTWAATAVRWGPYEE